MNPYFGKEKSKALPNPLLEEYDRLRSGEGVYAAAARDKAALERLHSKGKGIEFVKIDSISIQLSEPEVAGRCCNKKSPCR